MVFFPHLQGGAPGRNVGEHNCNFTRVCGTELVTLGFKPSNIWSGIYIYISLYVYRTSSYWFKSIKHNLGQHLICSFTQANSPWNQLRFAATTSWTAGATGPFSSVL